MLVEKEAEKAVLIVGLAQQSIRGDGATYLDQLSRIGVDESWFTGHEAAFWKAAMALRLQKRTLTNLDLIQQANSSIPLEYWKTIEGLWNNPPALDPLGFVSSLREARAGRKVEKIHARLGELLRDAPHDVSKWLPQATAAMQKIIEGSTPYDSNPRDIYLKSSLPVPFASTGYNILDSALMGGYRYGDLILFYGFTKTGKSSTIYSLLARACLAGLPCCFIKGERPLAEAAFQILKAGCGHLVTAEKLSDKDYNSDNFPDEEAAVAKDDMLRAMSECLTMHPLESRSTEELEQIIAIHRPVLVTIDPLENLKVSNWKGDEWKSQQVVAQQVLNIASSQKYPCAVVGTMQASPQQKEEWQESHTLKNLRGFGTNVWPMKATAVFMMDRHWVYPNMGYGMMLYRTRQGGAVEIPFTWPYDPRREAYVEEGE